MWSGETGLKGFYLIRPARLPKFDTVLILSKLYQNCIKTLYIKFASKWDTFIVSKLYQKKKKKKKRVTSNLIQFDIAILIFI